MRRSLLDEFAQMALFLAVDDAAACTAQRRCCEDAERHTRAPIKELRTARESVLGALVFNRLWELRHKHTRRIFKHTGMHHHFHLGWHPFESWDARQYISFSPVMAC